MGSAEVEGEKRSRRDSREQVYQVPRRERRAPTPRRRENLPGQSRGHLSPTGAALTVSLALERDRRPVAPPVRRAGLAAREVTLALPLLREGEIPAGEVRQASDQPPAGQHSAVRRNCGSSNPRSAWRARCSRILTAFSVTPRECAASSVDISSMSRSRRTAR